jgi:hypothetical protein
MIFSESNDKLLYISGITQMNSSAAADEIISNLKELAKIRGARMRLEDLSVMAEMQAVALIKDLSIRLIRMTADRDELRRLLEEEKAINSAYEVAE